MKIPNKIQIFSPYPVSSPLESAFMLFAELLQEKLELSVEAIHDSTIKNITKYFCEQKNNSDKLLLSGFGPSILDPLYAKTDYKPYRDLRFIAQVSKMPILFYTSKDSPYQTLFEIIKYVKKNPKSEIAIGYPFGGSPHFACAYLASLFNLKVNFTEAGIEELISKKVQLVCYHPFNDEQMAVLKNHCKVVMAFSSSAYYETSPSLNDLGIAFNITSWRALAAHKTINLSIAKRLSSATKEICYSSCFQRVLEQTHESSHWQGIETVQNWIKMQHLYFKSIMPQVKKYM